MEDVAGHAAAEVVEIAYSGTSLEPFIQSVKLKVGGKDTSHSAEIRNQLRPFIMDQLPISFTETGVPVERSLQDLIHFLAPEAIGFPRIARLVQELHVLAEKRRELVYYQYQDELKTKRTEEEAKRQTGIGRFFSSTGERVASSGVEQPVQTWAMGKRVPDWVAGPALLSSIFLQQAAANMPTYNRQMALVNGECVGVDHCHKLMRRVRGVEGQRVLEATLTMMTETGEVATSLWTHSTSLEVVRGNLRQVYERMASLGRAPRVLFCDWPEVMGPFFMDVWPGLEAYLMDILHAIMRVTKHVPEDHPFRGWLQSKLSEAIFVKNQADLVGIMKELEQKGKTLSDKAGKNALRRCRKAVPPPEILLARLEAVGDEASCKANPLTTEPLLGPHAQRAFQGLLHQARLGLLSDPPNMEMYYSKPTCGANARPQYACKRVGSRLEGFHVHFQAILKNYNISAELAWAVASTWLTGWNIRMRQANRGEPDHGPAFDLEILYRIGEQMEALGLAPAYRDVQFTMKETAETFGIQCTPAGFREAAAAFQEGEFAPTQFPEVAYLDASDSGPDFDAALELEYSLGAAHPQVAPVSGGCEPPDQPAVRGAQAQPVPSPLPTVPEEGAHDQPVVSPSAPVPTGGAHRQPVVSPSSPVPMGDAHDQPVVSPSPPIQTGGAHRQPVLSPSPPVPTGGAHRQPVVSPSLPVPTGGAHRQPVLFPHQPVVSPSPLPVSRGGAAHQPFVPPSLVGGALQQTAVSQPHAVHGGGAIRHLADAPQPAVPCRGACIQPAVSRPPAVLGGGARSQPVSQAPFVSRGAPCNLNRPTVALPPAAPRGPGARSQPALVPLRAAFGSGAVLAGGKRTVLPFSAGFSEHAGGQSVRPPATSLAGERRTSQLSAAALGDAGSRHGGFSTETLGRGLGVEQSTFEASPLQQVDPPDIVPEVSEAQPGYHGPLVYRPSGVESSRQKAGNQG
ncbi:hypothetical protein KFL_013750010, partial [Klebsormidium nitens]